MRSAGALIALAAGAALAAPSAPGRYDGELCVATQPSAAPSCGAADVEIASGAIVVRVADIAYRLVPRREQLDVATMHGSMEIDEFSAAYLWEGTTLRFNDVDKHVRYEVRIGARKSATR